MTTKKWALRVLLASAFFTGIICLSAPAHAEQAPMTQVQVEAFIKHEATCYVVAAKAGLVKQQARHLFRLDEFNVTHMMAIVYAVGFTEGWLAATEQYTGVSVEDQATAAHELMCLEQT